MSFGGSTCMSLDSLSVFGQGTYTLLDRLHLTVSLRYEYTELKGEFDYRLVIGVYINKDEEPYNENVIGNKKRSERLDNFELLPKFSVSYDITDNIMTYATGAVLITLPANLIAYGDVHNPSIYYNFEYT